MWRTLFLELLVQVADIDCGVGSVAAHRRQELDCRVAEAQSQRRERQLLQSKLRTRPQGESEKFKLGAAPLSLDSRKLKV